MNLRDCLVRHGIVDSRRLSKLPPATQLFFRNLLHTCDGAGRFVADADDLRTTLYRHVLDRVSRVHITRWLAECHTADLVTLYTGPDGRGYGEVLRYGQRDTKRKVIHPARDADQMNFAGPPAAPQAPADPPAIFSSSEVELNRREKNFPQPPPEAGAGEGDSFGSAVSDEPADTQADIGYRRQVDIDTELFKTMAGLEGSDLVYMTLPARRSIQRALTQIRKVQPGLHPLDLERAAARWKALFPTASITAKGFATHWPKLQGAAITPAAKAAPSLIEPEPPQWREFVNAEFPESKYARGGEREKTQWHDIDADIRRHLINSMITAGKLPADFLRQHRNAA